jgi:hypothetical protein
LTTPRIEGLRRLAQVTLAGLTSPILRFECIEVRAPSDKQVQAVLQSTITRMMKLLTRGGVLVQDMGQTYLAEPDADRDEARTLRPLQAAAVAYRIAFGPRAGQKALPLRGAMPREGTARQPLCADIDGFSLHAAVRVEAHDHKPLEQLCRNITRSALYDERVQLTAAGQVELKLKTPWRDCTTHLVMSPLDFMQRLAPMRPFRLYPPITASRPSISIVGCPVGSDPDSQYGELAACLPSLELMTPVCRRSPTTVPARGAGR